MKKIDATKLEKRIRLEMFKHKNQHIKAIDETENVIDRSFLIRAHNKEMVIYQKCLDIIIASLPVF